jgi:branched-chain amino acid transport system substrate-binding protein
MKQVNKVFLLLVCMTLCLIAYNPKVAFAANPASKVKTTKVLPGSMADKFKTVNAAFDASKLSDMSDFDPANPIIPTGDTIKIAVVASFSGPAANVGNLFWICVTWAAHDINKRGGIWVDGKKKLIQVIKADHMSKADQCKKVVERMILQEKVHVLWGTNGSHMMRIINETANKYKVIAMDAACLNDDLNDAKNFNRYSFHVAYSVEQVGRAIAYYYGQIRKKEKTFYILNQDYGFGYDLANAFKNGLKEYYPGAQIVGEDYHKLFLTDYAPYLEKIKHSNADIIFSGDWCPDGANLLKQARQMGIKAPFAHIYMTDFPNVLHDIGVEGTKGLNTLDAWAVDNPQFKTEGHKRIYNAWHDAWKNKFSAPYNTRDFELFTAIYGYRTMATYWLLSAIERAKSTDPEKIISVWENDTYQFVNGKIVFMRACDHKAVMDLAMSTFVPWEEQKVSMNIPPYYYYKGTSWYGPTDVIPAAKILPWMDQKLDRCKGKNCWGE